MTCYHPITAWRSAELNDNGKRPLVFNQKFALPESDEVHVPCGQCIGCRLEQSRQWATRVSLENQLHDKSIFMTLTYDDEHLPYQIDGDTGEMVPTLRPKHFTNFMKLLRFNIEKYYPNNGKIRFFGCGEYGSETKRPHYHIILFGFEPPDKKIYKTTFTGHKLYNSAFLEKCWNRGFINFGNVTFESAAYVARYCTKKITGEAAAEHYGVKEPEFVRMSRRPGIAKEWFDKYKNDVYPQDFIVIRDGIKCRPPKYFDKLAEKFFPDLFEEIKSYRVDNSVNSVRNELDFRGIYVNKPSADNSRYSLRELESMFYEYEVLPVKEEVCQAKMKKLKRPLEGDI